MPFLILLALIYGVGWVAYHLSPIPECREIATTLEQGSEAFFGVGPRWDWFNIADCVFAGEAKRQEWLSSAQVYKFDAVMLRENMNNRR